MRTKCIFKFSTTAMRPQIPILQAAPAAAPSRHAPQGWPLWRLGLRPFCLGAAAFGALAAPLWIAMVMGAWQPSLPMPALLWHAHEMLYGFAVAVIVGFLLTAGKAWTGLQTARGAALILALLALANAEFHLSVLGLVDVAPLRALHAGLAPVLMIECVIAGRVVPAFTMSALPGLKLKAPPRLELAALACTAVALGLWALAPAGPVAWLTAGALATAAVLHAWRLGQWQPLLTRRRPILWVMHAACAWLPIGFALLAVAQLAWLMGAAIAWSAAFGIYLAVFAPWLLRTRLDGKDG